MNLEKSYSSEFERMTNEKVPHGMHRNKKPCKTDDAVCNQQERRDAQTAFLMNG